MTISFIFLVLAFLCFIAGAVYVPPQPSRFNLIALGLAFWALTLLIGGGAR